MPTLAASSLKQDPKTNGLYDRDFYSWTMRQAEALKQRDLSAIDWDNLIEEIEDMGASYKKEWKNHCAQAIAHLLKIEYWDHATEGVLQHWEAEVMDFRQGMAEVIAENPGMKGQYDEMFAAAWKRGRSLAVKSLQKYDLKHRPPSAENTFLNWSGRLPQECPYRREHVAAFDPKTDQAPREDVWPPSVAKILNARLGKNYPALPDYEPSRSGWKR